MRPILLIMWTAFQSFILRHNNNKVKLARIKKWFLYRPKFAHQNQRMDLFPGETRLDQAEAFLKKTLTFGVQVRWGAGGREC